MRNRKPTLQTFGGARAALWTATVALAGFGAIGWGLALWEVSHHLALVAGLVALVAPLAAAALTGPAAHGAGLSAWLAIIIFTLMDAGSSANAIWAFDEAANASANKPAMVSYETDLIAAKATLAAANAALVALPTPDATGAIRKADTYAAAHTALSANVATAQATISALVKPEPVALFPKWLSGSVMALTAFALILGHLAVNTAARKAAAKSEATQARAKSRKRRPPVRKAPAVAPVASNVVPIVAPRKGSIH